MKTYYVFQHLRISKKFQLKKYFSIIYKLKMIALYIQIMLYVYPHFYQKAKIASEIP